MGWRGAGPHAISRYPIWERLPLVQAPTLVIHGTNSRIRPLHEPVVEALPDGRGVLVPSRAVFTPNEDPGLLARITLEFLREHVPPGVSPMCGNSICQDRRFLAREMPELERYFHYRNLDVSTLKILARQWAPEVAAGFSKDSTHRALADIRDSIEELAWYRDHLFDKSVLATPAA